MKVSKNRKDERWMTILDISQEIYKKAGWLIPVSCMREYLLYRLKPLGRIKKTKRGRFKIYVHPDDAKSVVEKQINEIRRFRAFCRKHGPCPANTFQEGKAVLKVSSPKAIAKLLDMTIPRAKRFIELYRIPVIRFEIIGFLSSENRCCFSYSHFNKVLEKIGSQGSEKHLDKLKQRERGKKILRDWWTARDVFNEIEREHPGWGNSFLNSIKEEIRKRRRVNEQLTDACIFLSKLRKHFFEPTLIKAIIEAQSRKISSLKEFAQTDFVPPRILNNSREARQLQKEWGVHKVAELFGVKADRFFNRHPDMIRYFRIFGIGSSRFVLISQKKFNCFLEKVKEQLDSLSSSLDVSNGPLTLDNIFEKWYTLRDIQKEINSRTGWSIPYISLKGYIKRRLPGLRLEKLTGDIFTYYPPTESRNLIEQQCSEIRRLRSFLQRKIKDLEIEDVDVKDSRRRELLLAKNFWAENIQRMFGLSRKEFQKMINEGLIEMDSFTTVGLGNHNLYAPLPSVVMELKVKNLIRIYCSLDECLNKKDVWVDLVKLAKNHPQEFIKIVSDDDSLKEFRESKQGKLLIDYIIGLLRRINIYKEQGNILFEFSG